MVIPEGHFHWSTRSLYKWSAESGECRARDMFHLDLGAAIAMAAIESSIPNRSITTIIILATLLRRGMV
jgi:hypothetical protein